MRIVSSQTTEPVATPPATPKQTSDAPPRPPSDGVSCMTSPRSQTRRGLLPALALASPALAPCDAPPGHRSMLAAGDAPTQIRPYLFVGGIDNARDRMLLLTLGITHILSAAAEYTPPFIPGMRTLHLPLYDRTNERSAPFFAAAKRWMDEARAADGRILVHCQHGISRSITLILAYLMQEEKLSLSQALTAVRAQRAASEPNPTFLGELRDLEQSLYGKVVSVQRLTLLDPGPLDLASSDAQSLSIVQRCLAAANKTTSVAERDASERYAATQLMRPTIKASAALVQQLIMQTFESFAGTAPRDSDARLALLRILDLLSEQDASGPAVLRCAIADLAQTAAWQELVLDAPLAPRFLAQLCTGLGAALS